MDLAPSTRKSLAIVRFRCAKSKNSGDKIQGPSWGQQKIRKRGGVQKSTGNKVPWKTGMLIYLPVTSRPLISPQKEAVLSPCNFATTRLTACILNFLSPLNVATHETEDPFAAPQKRRKKPLLAPPRPTFLSGLRWLKAA